MTVRPVREETRKPRVGFHTFTVAFTDADAPLPFNATFNSNKLVTTPVWPDKVYTYE